MNSIRTIFIGYERDFLDPDSDASKRFDRMASAEFSASVIVLSGGQKQTVRSSTHGRIYAFSGSATVRLWKAFFATLSEIRRARQAGESVILSAQDPFVAGMIAFKLSRWANVPYEIQEHGDHFAGFWEQESFMKRVLVRIAPFVFRRADRIRVVSDRVKDRIVRRFGVEESNVYVKQVDQDVSWHLEQPSHAWAEIPMIVVPCRFESQKGLDVFLDAAYQLRAHGLVFHARLIGSGSLEGWLRSRIASLGLERCVTIMPWASQEGLWSTSDLFVLSSNYEGWGRTIVEAMASRVAIVTTDVGCVGSFFRPQIDGRVVPVGNAKALADAIAEQLREKDRREWMVVQAYERAKRFASLQVEQARMQQGVWKSMIGSRGLGVGGWAAWKWTAVLLTGAIGLRALSVILFSASLGVNREWGFYTLVQSWFLGHGYTFANELGCASAYRSPGFLFFLTATYLLFGFGNFLAQAIIQNIVAVILVYLVYRLAWRVSNDRRVGWIAGAVTALHPYTFYHYTQYYHTVFSATFLAGLFLMLLRLERTKKLRDAAWTGVLIALLAYVQGTILPLMPFLSLWLLWRWHWAWGKAIAAVSVMAIVSMAIIAPWTIRNWQVFHRFIPLTTDMGFALYKANSENIYGLTKLGFPQEVVGIEVVNPKNPLEVKYEMYPEAELALREQGMFRSSSRFWTEWHPREPVARGELSCSQLSSLSEPEVSAHWSGIAKEWLRDNYLWEGVKLQGLKLISFWSPWLQPARKYGASWSFGNEGLVATLARNALVIYGWFLLVFGAIGTWVCVRQRRFGFVLPFFIVFAGYSLLHTFFAGYTKYRIPLDGLVAILAAIAVVAVWDALMKKRTNV